MHMSVCHACMNTYVVCVHMCCMHVYIHVYMLHACVYMCMCVCVVCTCVICMCMLCHAYICVVWRCMHVYMHVHVICMCVECVYVHVCGVCMCIWCMNVCMCCMHVCHCMYVCYMHMCGMFMCMHTCMKTTSWCENLPLSCASLFLVWGSLTESGDHQFSGLTGHWLPVIYVPLPCSPTLEPWTHHMQLPGIQTWVSMLTKQVLCPLNHLSSPKLEVIGHYLQFLCWGVPLHDITKYTYWLINSKREQNHGMAGLSCILWTRNSIQYTVFWYTVGTQQIVAKRMTQSLRQATGKVMYSALWLNIILTVNWRQIFLFIQVGRAN